MVKNGANQVNHASENGYDVCCDAEMVNGGDGHAI
jgi:hypothetical protein